jgi:hypothetical protein
MLQKFTHNPMLVIVLRISFASIFFFFNSFVFEYIYFIFQYNNQQVPFCALVKIPICDVHLPSFGNVQNNSYKPKCILFNLNKILILLFFLSSSTILLITVDSLHDAFYLFIVIFYWTFFFSFWVIFILKRILFLYKNNTEI